jgi:HD-GYP domain-containing protein (c-di-GMP phosphodiesterase class II)
MYMGEQMRFGPARMERLRFAALMHDMGKLVVPNHILNKPGKLTEEEFARVRVHEKVTVQMLSRIEFLRPIASSAHSDNTTFDPDDPAHPIEPYIVMIADAYDAMTSTRAYRKALPQEVAFTELRDKAGIQFHPACVEALIAAIEARGERHGAGYEVQEEFADAPEAGLGSAGLGDLLPAEA